MITREQWEERQQQWAELHRWEREQPPIEYSPDDAIDGVGEILEWIPKAVRSEERDPERLGIQRMNSLVRLVRPE